jgi:antibiotic biosynthesis monooxygenase (ABM) superfamily enzyme
MPTDSLLVAIGVCFIFLLFAFVIAWADHTTSRWLSARATAKQTAPAAYPHDHKAA